MTFSYNLVFETVDDGADINIDFSNTGEEYKSERNTTSKKENSCEDQLKDPKETPENSDSDTTEQISKDKETSETPKSEKKANQDNLVERRAKERGSRIPSEIIIETYYSKMNYSEAVSGSSCSSGAVGGGAIGGGVTPSSSSGAIGAGVTPSSSTGAIGAGVGLTPSSSSGAIGGGGIASSSNTNRGNNLSSSSGSNLSSSSSSAASSTSLIRKTTVRTGFSRESTPAGGSKDFPPLPSHKELQVSRSREGSISTTSESKESTPSERSRQKSSKESTPVEPDTINFISGNPFVEVTKGIIHLFKDKNDPEYRSTAMMCMYGVPAQHKTSEILQFTAPCHQDLEYMRFIHDGSPNQYIVLLKFRSTESATEFQEVYNGRPYNNMEPDICSVLPVSSVQHCKESEYYPATEGSTELPYCTICLERMDESVSTVLTILCNHKFHTGCLAQWEDPTCPVCRHVQTPEMVAEHVCSNCQSSSDLWICLVCGFVGCGRYAGGHAHQHFLETQHCYSMELGHNRVWDYVGDNFVHRLVQNTSDGKLVEQEVGGEDHKHREHVGGLPVDSDEKMDSLQLEYTYLLTSQLESQREYFEGKLLRVQEDAAKEIQGLSDRCRVEEEERGKIQKQLDTMNKDKGKLESKLSQLTTKLSQLTASLEEEQQLNRSLRQNQDDWQMKLKKAEIELNVNREQKDREVQDLKDQVRDLMFFLEAQNKIAESPLCTEMQEGTLCVREGETEDGESPRKQGKRGGKRRGH